MRQQLLRILICLIVGAVTTISIAWIHAASFDGMNMSAENPWVHGVSHEGYPYWQATMSTWGGSTVVSHKPVDATISPNPPPLPADVSPDQIEEWLRRQREAAQGLPPSTMPDDPVVAIPYWSRAASRPAEISRDVNYLDDARGWPFRAMMSFHDGTWSAGSAGSIHTPIGADWRWDFGEPHGLGGVPRGFPLRPIWWGFLADTVIFASIAFALLGIFPAMRALRRRKGRCPQCGYDLRGALDAGCPECGWRRC